MKSGSLLICAILFGAILISNSCKAKKLAAGECAGVAPTYTANVKSIIDVNCANTCHSAANHAAGIDLSTYNGVKTVGTEARFLGAIRHLAGYDPMPMKAEKLSDSTIRVISCWLQNGAPE